MSGSGAEFGIGRHRWRLATSAAELLAVDPCGLAGIVVHSGPSPILDQWIENFRQLLPVDAPWRRLPVGVPASRLAGGLDLAATLAAGKPLFAQGLMSEADGGVIIAPMAERMEVASTAFLAAALDEKIVRTERDGFSRNDPARFALLLIDEGSGPDETVCARLKDRLAFEVVLDGLAQSDAVDRTASLDAIARASGRLPSTHIPDSLIESLCAAAMRSGVLSLRALTLAVAATRASAALAARACATEEDAELAAVLVLGPRAILAQPDVEGSEPQAAPDTGEGDAESPGEGGPLEDRIIAAVKAAVDANLLGAGGDRSRSGRLMSAGKSGDTRKSLAKGRPYGARSGDPSKHGRLALVDTLRAAAPWQKIRGRSSFDKPVEVRRDDLRVTRFRHREQSLTVFVVDASGSAAMQRLGETKGAIELLFARSYSRRDEVALIAFRKSGAEVLVPPTRSLVRARRLLADLPGGGGTPIAAGIESAIALSAKAAARGRTPTIVLLTDGRANVALNGEGGREAAQRDAFASARRLRIAGFRVLLFDTSARPEPLAAALASEMGGRYLPLPHSDSRLIAAAITMQGGRPK